MLSILDNKKLNILVSNTYKQPFDVLIANTDTLESLKTIPSETVELIVSSPPYNLG